VYFFAFHKTRYQNFALMWLKSEEHVNIKL
jgi:hypothetical protein